jgi:excisionase family DNA binding protein
MRLVTIKVASTFLMVKTSTIYSWVHNGSIPFHRLNGLIRFDMDELEQWVKDSDKSLIMHSVKPLKKNIDVNKIVKNTIDAARRKEYNLSNGKPGQHHGLRKEV